MKGDYIGFSYNGFHSSDLGIIRVSDGSRFNENLLPSQQEIIVSVPGQEGSHYFGAYYTQKPITISYAFDGLTEAQVQYLSQVFGDKGVHPLVFDERPYKTYYAKVKDSMQIKYIPFGDETYGRIYKGEGSISFVCYQPYAICEKKYLSEYRQEWDNVDEWKDASRLLEDNTSLGGNELDTIDENGYINVYNPGVKEADWVMSLITEDNNFYGGTLSIGGSHLTFLTCEAKGPAEQKDQLITFSSKTGLIEGWRESRRNQDGTVAEYKKTGNLYNEFIESGGFFTIPITCKSEIREGSLVNIREAAIFSVLDEDERGSMKDQFSSLEYNYYYY